MCCFAVLFWINSWTGAMLLQKAWRMHLLTWSLSIQCAFCCRTHCSRTPSMNGAVLNQTMICTSCRDVLPMEIAGRSSEISCPGDCCIGLFREPCARMTECDSGSCCEFCMQDADASFQHNWGLGGQAKEEVLEHSAILPQRAFPGVPSIRMTCNSCPFIWCSSKYLTWSIYVTLEPQFTEIW